MNNYERVSPNAILRMCPLWIGAGREERVCFASASGEKLPDIIAVMSTLQNAAPTSSRARLKSRGRKSRTHLPT